MSQFARASAVIALTPAADQSAKKGFLVTIAGSTATVHVTSTTTVPAKGVILDGTTTAGKSSVAILGSGIPPVKIKAGGTITKGDFVSQNTDGTVITDPGTGSRVRVGIALEDGTVDELIEVATLPPVALS